jgi:hypothetical protein
LSSALAKRVSDSGTVTFRSSANAFGETPSR